MSSGYVMFRLGDRSFATPLDEVREIVRLTGIERLPGLQAPLAGLIVLRGAPLPVMDVRAAGSPEDSGDVLVMDADGDAVGVAVDAVLAVLHPDELPPGNAPTRLLPPYVTGVRRRGTTPVLLVDLRLLVEVSAAADAQRPAAGEPGTVVVGAGRSGTTAAP